MVASNLFFYEFYNSLSTVFLLVNSFSIRVYLLCNINMDQQTTEEEITTTEVSAPQQVVRTTKQVTPDVRVEHPQKVYDKKRKIFRFNQIIWYILVFFEVLLIFRGIFKAIGANPLSGFVGLIYGFTNIMVTPFQGIISSMVSGNSVLEWATAIAGVVYALIAWGLVYLLQFIKPVTPHEVEEQVG